MEHFVAFFAGAFAAMGLGGGCVFLVAGLLIQNLPQLSAQGLNLLFFLPTGLVSLIFHQKNHLIRWKAAVPLMIGGCIGGILGAYGASLLPEQWLRYAFALLLFVLGIRQLLAKKPDDSAQRQEISPSRKK